MTEPAPTLDLDAIAEYHAPFAATDEEARSVPICGGCGDAWPCDTAQLVVRVRELEADDASAWAFNAELATKMLTLAAEVGHLRTALHQIGNVCSIATIPDEDGGYPCVGCQEMATIAIRALRP